MKKIKIKHGDYINIAGNQHNPTAPIKVTIASQTSDPWYHPKAGEPEQAWINAQATVICANPSQNFSKGHVRNIEVNYGDVFDTSQGKFRLVKEPLSDGRLVLLGKVR